MPTWINDTIWWHIYPLGFTGAAIRPSNEAERVQTPRLEQIIPWLDYLKELGATGLSLCPIFESDTHGYDTTDFFRIDPRMGDDASFDKLVAACRERGLALMLDGVFNHVGHTHPLFKQALEGGPSESLFRITRHPDGRVEYEDFEGHQRLPALNHSAEEVVQMVIDVMCHWLGRGASAWRLDAAYHVPTRFWRRVLPVVRERFPDVWFVGEVIHGNYQRYVHKSGLDSVTQYELWKAAWSSLLDANFFELDWCLKRHNEMLATFTPKTFIGNHDVTRVATKIGERKAALAFVILMTVGGIPSLYYGDELLYHGDKKEGEHLDDDLRPAYPACPSQLPARDSWMFHLLKQLTALRHRHPWLSTAFTQPIVLENRHYTYEVLGREGQKLKVTLMLDPEPRAIIEDGEHKLLDFTSPGEG
ncbi:MAG: alpha-amylase family protein [Lautropia sp.]|nr:alpha-amylase family protein [Lautropia sp.]